MLTQRGNVMLVLSRRVGEAIVVGGNIRILVLSVTGSSVRIGVQAPRSVTVHREEVLAQAGELPADLAEHPEGEPRSRHGQHR
jgi:carbon storage regulator